MPNPSSSSQSSRELAKSWPYPRHRNFENALRKAAAAWFAAKGFPIHPVYPYCLASWDDWPKNIIEPSVAAYIEKIRTARAERGEGFPLHKYVHHGLSSQALLFNLVGPLIVANDLDPLRKAASDQGLDWPDANTTADFEYEDRQVFNEDSGQPTSIDLVIKNSTGAPRLFLECKLVEKEFGGCSVFTEGDCDGRNPATDPSLCYLHHIGRKYWDMLARHGFLDGSLRKESTCILSSYYQFFRELLVAIEKGGTFILLSDERSPTFICHGPSGDRGLIPFLLTLVPEDLRHRVGRITVQSLLAHIQETGRHPWVPVFQEKYGLL